MFANTPGQQTDQAETMELEARGTGGDEEDPSSGSADIVSE